MSDNDTMKTFRAGLVFLCMLLMPPVVSGMTILGDGDLAACRGGSGVSIGISGTAQITVGSHWYQDTDYDILSLGYKNRIEFENIVKSLSIVTLPGDPITIDVASNSTGRTYVYLQNPAQVSSSFSANLHFDEYSPGAYSNDLGYYNPGNGDLDHITDYIVHDLGTINVSNMVRTESSLLIGAHAYGGVDFYQEAKTDIDFAQFAYNTPVSTNALTFTGIHLAGSASGDPRYPNGGPEPSPGPYTYQHWGFSGTFKIGDIADGPAQVDIGTSASGVTNMQLKLPMEGSLRVEDVKFGGSDFGPLALDGIEVHRLAIQINPKP
jgi:hypothetical protein